ncbi:MAG: PHP domain-containing protein [Gemmatimonadaceae bacterium]
MTTPAPSPALVDLHMHSTASDGATAPADVVAEAQRVGLAAIALTDHDTLAGLAEARAAGATAGIRVIAGVELSAVEGEQETHLLGLHLADTDEMERRLVDLREMRHRRADAMVAKLNALGIGVTMDEVLAQAAGGAIGRPHVARAVVARGGAADLRDAFDRLLGNGRPAYVGKERLTMDDAIAMIHRAGGLAVLAHPGPTATRPRLEALKALGLDGVEVRHPSHSDEEIGRILRLTESLDLLPSGGSDWHGATDGWRTLGSMRVPVDWLARQDALVAQRAAV